LPYNLIPLNPQKNKHLLTVSIAQTMKRNLLLILALLLPILVQAQQEKPKVLLTDINVQLDATQAVNDMYNFKFAKAEQQFRWLKQQYPRHPLPYFLLGLSEWWKIVPNIDNTQYDEKMLAYMDTTITMAENLLDKDENNIDANFFLAAAYGFVGRLHSERKNWRKATFAGKNGFSYMEKSRANVEASPEIMSPELLFGDALFNYYAEWISENYLLLRPVLAFFPKGDKQLGLQQLSDVSRNAFYTRTEAQYFLMRIYSNDENRPDLALPIAEYLATTFPDNAYFQRYYARLLFSQGNLMMAEKISLDILDKLKKEMPGYEATSGRYASFFLGYIYKLRRNYDQAKLYFNESIKYTQQIKAFDTGYFHYSLTNLAQIADNEGDYDTAINYYKQVVKEADRKSAVRKEAEKYLKEVKKKRRKERRAA
jgi:hypothetical protein